MDKLTKKQRENLSSMMAVLTLKYNKDENVECIYLTPYETEDGIFYDFVVVFSNIDSAEKFDDKMEKYNEMYGSEKLKSKFGGHIRRFSDYADYYEELAVNPSKVNRVKELLSSRILYTKKGYGRHYHRVAHQFDKYNTMEKYHNMVKLKMPKNNKGE